ncbi:MAG: hypothetical protein ACT4PT_00800 [Methanobacteriota archaeon]
MRAPTVVLLLVLPAVAGCIGPDDQLHVAVSAPRLGDSATVDVVVTRGAPWSGGDGKVSLVIEKDGARLYPRGFEVSFPIERGRGTLALPYGHFVVDNGVYTARVTQGDISAETTFEVRKWVNYLYVRPLDDREESAVRIEFALEQAAGDPTVNPVITSGIVDLQIMFERNEAPAGPVPVLPIGAPANESRKLVHVDSFRVDDKAIFAHVVSYAKFSRDVQNGDVYNVTALFHNAEVRTNANVPLDPTLASTDPPRNWVKVQR